jgi:hypothetical protein
MGDDDDAPRPVLSRLFWIAIALAFVCIGAGAVVGLYGSKLFPPHRAAPHALGNPAPPR